MSQPPAETTADGARDDRDDARLARLEQLIDDLSARLRAVEGQLNVSTPPTQQTEARPFGQGTATARGGETHAPSMSHADSTPDAPPEASHVEPRATGERAATDEGASRVEGEGGVGVEPAEDYPFTVLPTHVEETEAHEPFPASELNAAYARERAARFGEREGEASRARVDESAASPVGRARRDVEAIVGGSLFNWLGIIAVTVAVGFFLKLAFEHEWIGPAARVLLGGAAGCGVLALAEFLRARGYRAYAHVLTGGGILILYLSVYAARGLYELVGVTVAFALMSVVTATAVALSVRHDSRSIAVLGLIGGFMTPALLSTGVDRQIALFTYIAFLDAGVLALAYFKRWRVLDHLAFVATVLTFIGWYAAYFAEWKTARTFFFLTLFFLMFSALAVLHNVLRQRKARWLDLSLVIANATLYFAASYGLLEVRYAYALGAFALAVAVFYALLSYVAYTYHREDRLLASAYVGASATFLAIAVAVQFHQHWITIGWAAEGLALTWLGLRTRERAPRLFALAVFVFAVEHWFTADLRDFFYGNVEPFTPIINAHGLSCAALIAALAAAIYLYRRAEVDRDEREIISSVLILAGNALALTLLSVDINDYFNLRARGEAARSTARDNTRQLSLTLLWALYAAGALGVGVMRRLAVLRFAALFVLFVCVVKLCAADAPYYDATWHVVAFNQTFFAFVALVAVLAFGARLYARAGDAIDARERVPLMYLLASAANVLAVAGLSLEALGYFDRSQSLVASGATPDSLAVVNNLENTKQLALTFVWSLYACAAFTIGVRRARPYVRYGALALLALAGGKIIGFDARFYDAAWHAPLFNQTFAAFAVFVAAVAYVARVYAPAANVDEEERRGAVGVLTVVGNLFAVAALSLEASGYFRKQLSERAAAGANTRDLRLAQQLSLSLVWAVYGGAMLAFGHVRQNKLLRLMALALLAATTFKVFLFDLSELDQVYRIVSFIVLGLVLLGVSFLYQQRQRRANEGEEGSLK
jgi:uncharacterized membrane protein